MLVVGMVLLTPSGAAANTCPLIGIIDCPGPGLAPEPAPLVPAPLGQVPLGEAPPTGTAEPAGTTTTSEPAQPTAEEAAARLLVLLNTERADAGLTLLTVRSDVAEISARWSASMARRGELAHNKGYFAERRRLAADAMAENVARDVNVERAHRALMDSPGHRANILDARFSVVGLGAVRSNGTWWITEDFLQPASAATAARRSTTLSAHGGRGGVRGSATPPSPGRTVHAASASSASGGAVVTTGAGGSVFAAGSAAGPDAGPTVADLPLPAASPASPVSAASPASPMSPGPGVAVLAGEPVLDPQLPLGALAASLLLIVAAAGLRRIGNRWVRGLPEAAGTAHSTSSGSTGADFATAGSTGAGSTGAGSTESGAAATVRRTGAERPDQLVRAGPAADLHRHLAAIDAWVRTLDDRWGVLAEADKRLAMQVIRRNSEAAMHELPALAAFS